MGLKKTICTLLCLMMCVSFSYSQSKIGYSQKGRASYYANRFQGQRTASGEKYNNNALTAAHPKLPFNTMVKVTNLANGKSVIVRVNDRGPFSKARILDVSRTAAKALSIIGNGTGLVTLEVVGLDGKVTATDADLLTLKARMKQQDMEAEHQQRERTVMVLAAHRKKLADQSQKAGEKLEEENRKAEEVFNNRFIANNAYSIWGTPKSPKGFGIQIASFTDLANARDEAKSLNSAKINEVYIQVALEHGQKLYRVVVGNFQAKRDAKKYVPTIEKAGYEGFVTKHPDNKQLAITSK